jgi:cytochrome c peroxidase
MGSRQGTATRQSFIVGASTLTAALVAGAFALPRHTVAHETRPDELTSVNPKGVHRTFTTAGSIDTNNPFFQDLGTNGRTCFTCHRPAQAWSITPEEVQDRFERTAGLDPIFRTNDGSNCEGADVSTLKKRRHAFSLLLTKGLIRIGLEVPASAEFDIVDVDDPYRCGALFTSVSMYRRPLPTTNLKFLSTVMWDGREMVPGQGIRDILATQALHATTGHADGPHLSDAQMRAIVDFELGLFTAQTHDRGAGSLAVHGAFGGPRAVAREPFCIGINDPLGMLPPVPDACATPTTRFDPHVFTTFEAWSRSRSRERASIARGEAIFNTRHFVIDNVAGLNGGPQDPVKGPIASGTCTLCHDTPNAGNHSVSMALDIGLTDPSQRTRDLPLYTLRNRTTGQLTRTTDPGRAMVTGKWNDIGKFKGPILRALAARAPYFHNGSAATLATVVDFYETRFRIRLTKQDRADLVAFLEAL